MGLFDGAFPEAGNDGIPPYGLPKGPSGLPDWLWRNPGLQLAANDTPFNPFGPPPKPPGRVVDVTPVPNIFSGMNDSVYTRYIWDKLLFEPRNLQDNGFYIGTGDHGSNYLDPTPMELLRPFGYKR
jgi:hypothetical protein